MFILMFSAFVVKIPKNWKAFDQIKHDRAFKEKNFNFFFFFFSREKLGILTEDQV